MIESQTGEFVSLIDTLSRQGLPLDTNALTKVAKALSRVFGVDPDEVAILALNPKDKTLQFVIPEKLAIVGTIPLTSNAALASRTVRDRRPELVNNFSTSRHATVFEGVPLGRDPAELIQKIMSAPILDGAQVRGVVQISRKGRSATSAGSDFTQKDLHALAALSPTLERFLKLCKL